MESLDAFDVRRSPPRRGRIGSCEEAGEGHVKRVSAAAITGHSLTPAPPPLPDLLSPRVVSTRCVPNSPPLLSPRPFVGSPSPAAILGLSFLFIFLQPETSARAPRGCEPGSLNVCRVSDGVPMVSRNLPASFFNAAAAPACGLELYDYDPWHQHYAGYGHAHRHAAEYHAAAAHHNMAAAQYGGLLLGRGSLHAQYKPVEWPHHAHHAHHSHHAHHASPHLDPAACSPYSYPAPPGRHVQTHARVDGPALEYWFIVHTLIIKSMTSERVFSESATCSSDPRWTVAAAGERTERAATHSLSCGAAGGGRGAR
ncbi:putative vestigial, partial [Danaus plexippus plexippus]